MCSPSLIFKSYSVIGKESHETSSILATAADLSSRSFSHRWNIDEVAAC